MHYDAIANTHGLALDPFKALVAPRPIAWVSTLSAAGAANLAPYSYFNAFAENPHYLAIGSGASRSGGKKDSLANIEETGEFVVNLVTFALRDAMNASSANVAHGVDEFELAGLEKAQSLAVKPPRVARSPAAFECRLFRVIDLPGEGGHIDNRMIIGRVAVIHIDDRYIENGRVNTAAMQPVARLGYSEYATVTEAWRLRRPD
jgi:flavin reductase (DIM6/NTAB) family NADH-FMN oxidoreductase RutF